MKTHTFICTNCQGDDEPCKLSWTVDCNILYPPTLCPFNSGRPEWINASQPPVEANGNCDHPFKYKRVDGDYAVCDLCGKRWKIALA